jgi:creatinine amidohydrolase
VKDIAVATDSLFADTIAEMTAPMVAAAARRGAGVLLPIGVMEAHGPHLPTGTDTYIALTLCRLTRRYAAAQGVDLVIAPPYFWGINQVLSAFAGSFRTRPETAAALLQDIIESFLAFGFAEVHLVSHHGDLAHNQMILGVIEMFHDRGHDRVRWLYAPQRWQMFQRLGHTGAEPVWVPWDPPAELARLKTTGILGVHADEYETAAMVRYWPDLVDFDVLQGLEPTRLDRDDLQRWRKGGEEARAVTPDAYFGAPRPIDPDLWRHYDYEARAMAAGIAADRRSGGTSGPPVRLRRKDR